MSYCNILQGLEAISWGIKLDICLSSTAANFVADQISCSDIIMLYQVGFVMKWTYWEDEKFSQLGESVNPEMLHACNVTFEISWEDRCVAIYLSLSYNSYTKRAVTGIGQIGV